MRLGAFREAYYDVLYAHEIGEIEHWLGNPRTRELLRRQTKELLQEMLRHIEAEDLVQSHELGAHGGDE